MVAFPSLFVSRPRFILLEVFKCLKNVNPQYLYNLSKVKQNEDCLLNGTRLLQPKVRPIRSGDNDSTGFWPPGSLHTMGADGHI